MLSGTPMFARPIELCTQLFSLRPDIFPSEMEFQNRYCDPKLIQFGKRHIKEYKGSTNQDELKWFLDRYFMIRRLKKEVLSELPDKIRSKFILSDLNQTALNEVQRIKQELSELERLEVNPEDMSKLDNSMRLTIME